MIIKRAAIVLNGFVHDFMTGYWLSAMITIYLLNDFQVKYPALVDLLGSVKRFFFWNTVAGVVVILATGGMRSFTYVDNFFGPEAEQTRRRMLIIKHVILLALFGGGEYWAYGVTFG
jgi:uncharacterized membrane protein